MAASGAAGCLLIPPAGVAQADYGDGNDDGSIAVWSAHCYFEQNAFVDPIMSWGSPWVHMHSFAGAAAVTSTTNPADLRGVDDEDTTCKNPKIPSGEMYDKSAYWAPALRSITVTPTDWLEPEDILIYYRNAGVDPDTIVPFDQRLSFVAGDMDATSPQPDYKVQWSCVAADGPGHGGDNEENFGQTIPDWCPQTYTDGSFTSDYTVRMVIYFPNCLTLGALDDGFTISHGRWIPSEDEEKTSYAVPIDGGGPGGGITKECPGEDQTPIPQVQIGFRWNLTDANVPGFTDPGTGEERWDLTSMKLSSDAAPGQTDGESAHADFMSGWTTEQVASLLTRCFWTDEHVPPGDGPRHCGAVGDELEN